MICNRLDTTLPFIRNRVNYGSLDYRQHGNRSTSFVNTMPMANNNSLPNGGFGILGNCSMPMTIGAPQRYPQNTGYNSMFPNGAQQQQQQQSGRLMYRSNPSYLPRGAQFGGALDPQVPPNMPPPMPLFSTQPRPQGPHQTTLLPQPNPAAMHLFAAAAAAGLHASSNTVGNNGGQVSVAPGTAGQFHTAPYQTFHPVSMFSASNQVSGQPISSHCRDGNGATVMFQQPPPTGQFYSGVSGSLGPTTPTLSSTNTSTQQALAQQQTTFMPGNFHIPYYGQPHQQQFGATPNGAPQRQSPHHHHQAAVAAALAAAMSNGAQVAATMESSSVNMPPMQTDGALQLDASSPSASSVKAGTVIQPVYRSNGAGDWWPAAGPT